VWSEEFEVVRRMRNERFWPRRFCDRNGRRESPLDSPSDNNQVITVASVKAGLPGVCFSAESLMNQCESTLRCGCVVLDVFSWCYRLLGTAKFSSAAWNSDRSCYGFQSQNGCSRKPPERNKGRRRHLARQDSKGSSRRFHQFNRASGLTHSKRGPFFFTRH